MLWKEGSILFGRNDKESLLKRVPFERDFQSGVEFPHVRISMILNDTKI
jgi:hypothetical protein